MKKTPFAPAIAVVLFLAYLIVGCGGGSLNGNRDHSTTTTTSTTGGATTTGGGTGGILVNAAAGGTVTSTNGACLVAIPAKSLVANTKISINPVTTSLPTTPQNTVAVAGSVYEMGPDGEFFNTAPTLRIAYSPSAIPTGISERDLQIYSVVNGAWEPVLNSTDDPVNHIISATITHFSIYAVISLTTYTGGPQYDLIDCGVVSGDTASSPGGLSSDGRVAGTSTSSSGIVHAFSWTNGLTVNLGTRAGDVAAVATCINDAGVAGGKSIQDPLAAYPVLFSGGVVTQVYTASGQTSGEVTAINNNGSYIVGSAIVAQSTLTSFSNFAPGTTAAALNNSDTVAGYVGSKAAIWSGGSVTTLPLLTGYDSAVGIAMGDNGDVAGNAFNAADNKPVGFLYSSATMTEVPPLTGDDILAVAGVNGGKVVGTSTLDFTNSHPVIYSGGVTQNLNTLIPTGTGWTITQALGINASGQIVCSGTNGTANHALLLNPRPGIAIVFKKK